MLTDRIEAFVTDLTARLQRETPSGPYDTGTPGTLIGKPVQVYGQDTSDQTMPW